MKAEAEKRPSEQEILETIAKTEQILAGMKASRWDRFFNRVGYIAESALEGMKTGAAIGVVQGGAFGAYAGGVPTGGVGAVPGALLGAGAMGLAYGAVGAVAGVLEGIFHKKGYNRYLRGKAVERLKKSRADEVDNVAGALAGF